MDISKKTTILFSYAEHQRLTALAAQRGVSLGWLVREACVAQYSAVDPLAQRAAAWALAALSLPVGSTGQMKLESVPAHELMP